MALTLSNLGYMCCVADNLILSLSLSGLFYLCVCVFSCMSMWITCVLESMEARKGCQMLWNLELQMVVSLYVGTGERTRVLCKSSQCS